MTEIIPLTAFDDNYIWLIKDSQSQGCILVDPGDIDPILPILTEQKLILTAILITHGHNDHSGGVEALISKYPNVKVYSYKKLFSKSICVKENDKLRFFCDRLQLTVMETPGHTLDHISFYNKELVFCGDTLFSGGCGRVFEGTFIQMFESLLKIYNLSEATKVYCAHEYTLTNLIFAKHLDPKNNKLLEYIEEVKLKRKQKTPSLPSSVKLEKQINPFLLCNDPSFREHIEGRFANQLDDNLACFTLLREMKDNF